MRGALIPRLTQVLRGFPTRRLVSVPLICGAVFGSCGALRTCVVFPCEGSFPWYAVNNASTHSGAVRFPIRRFAPLRRGVWDSGNSLEQCAVLHWPGSFVPCEVFLASWLTRVCRGVLSNWFAPIARGFFRLYAWGARGSRGIAPEGSLGFFAGFRSIGSLPRHAVATDFAYQITVRSDLTRCSACKAR